MNRQEWRWLAWVSLTLILISNLPYLIAWAASPGDARFTGLVFNPQDGHSYLSKMRQGLDGSWRFHLAFTPERSRGAPIFLFHLWLGHVARWTGLPLVVGYHGARILGGMAMLGAIYVLIAQLSQDTRERGTMFLLTSAGSGLGWLVGLAGLRTADLWVAEAFPSYSLMVNAHFPLAIALMALIAVCGLQIIEVNLRPERRTKEIWPWGLGMMMAALFLSAIQPFGLVPVFGGLGIMLARRALYDQLIPWRTAGWIVAAAAVALPYPLCAQIAIHADPLLAQWSVQNVTSSPPLWDWALSYGLLLPLAAFGVGVVIRRRSDGGYLTLAWTAVTTIGMYLPLALQRRLSLGLGVPIGLLAGLGWWRIVQPRIQARRRSLLRRLTVALTMLTPIVLILMVSVAALSGEPWFYMSDGEWAALRWLREEASSGSVVLCAPQTGSFVPAWSGQPVVYGHPFETADAERRKANVKAYWLGEMPESEKKAFLRRNRVSYILVGPRERALIRERRDESSAIPQGKLAFEAGDVVVYQVKR